jgi:hypothetical protein
MYLNVISMQTKMPVLRKEYELSVSRSANGEDDGLEMVEEITIEGYKVIFDKKVAVIPTEFVQINQTLE